MNWFRLINDRQELLGQILLPDGELASDPYYVFQRLERMPMRPWSEPVPAIVNTRQIAIYRQDRGECILAHGSLEDLEKSPNVRFFPSYGLTSGMVKP